MRLSIEIIVIAALLAFGWEKSFKERLWEGKPIWPTVGGHRSTAPLAAPTNGPSPSAGWMWDKDRHSALNPPSHKQPGPHAV